MDEATSEAVAQLAQDFGEALLRFSASMRSPDTLTRGVPAPQPGEGPSGRRQQEVMALPEVSTKAGVSAGQVATDLGIRQPNAYTVLKSLVESGWLEVVPDVEPTHWRAT